MEPYSRFRRDLEPIDAQTEPAGQRPGDLLPDTGDGFDIGQHLARAASHFRTDGGQAHGLGRALEQRHAELRHELLDLCAEHGMADVEGGRGAAEMAVVGKCDDVAQVL